MNRHSSADASLSIRSQSRKWAPRFDCAPKERRRPKAPPQLVGSVGYYYATLRGRPHQPSPTSAEPNRMSDAGSGTGAILESVLHWTPSAPAVSTRCSVREYGVPAVPAPVILVAEAPEKGPIVPIKVVFAKSEFPA